MATNESSSFGSGPQTVPADTGHRSASEITLDDLKVAVVESLEGRPNHTCKRDDIGKWVIKHLGVDVRRGPRQVFKKRVHKAVGYLKQANVVVPYMATNPRLKLALDYAQRLTELKRKYARRARAARQPEAISALFDPVADVDSELDCDAPIPAFSGVELPDIPETAEFDDLPEEADAFRDDDDDSVTPDEAQAMGVLLGERPDDSLPHDQYVAPAAHDSLTPDGLLTYLERALSDLTGVAVERVLNELQVMFDADGQILTATMAHRRSRNELQFRVVLPFVQEAGPDLLRLCGDDTCSGTIGITHVLETPHYVFRQSINTIGRPSSEVFNAIEQLLREASLAAVIVARHR